MREHEAGPDDGTIPDTAMHGTVERANEADLASLTERQRWGIIALLLVFCGISGVVMGFVTPLLSLMLEERGYSASVAGTLVACRSLTMIATGPFIAGAVRMMGARNAIYAGMLGTGVAFPLLALFDTLPAWFFLVIVSAPIGAVAWVVSETLVNAFATDKMRGRAVALYAVIFAGGLSAGPLLVGITGTEKWVAMPVAALICVAGCIPLLFIRHWPSHGGEDAVPPKIIDSLRIAPLVVLGGLLSGLGENAGWTIIPYWIIGQNGAETLAVIAVSVFAAGAVIFQIIPGLLVGRIDMYRMLLIAALLGLAAALGLMFLSHTLALWPSLMLAGGGSAALYTIALIILGQRFTGERLTSMNAAFVMAYLAGGVIGPPTAGFAVDIAGTIGLPLVLLAGFGLYVLLALYQGREKPGGGAHGRTG